MTPERQLDILIRARTILGHPSRWGQGRFISDLTIVDRIMGRPRRFCLMGAISVAATGYIPNVSASTMWTVDVRDVSGFLASLIAPDDTARSPYGLGMMTWNDRHTHYEVLRLLDLAILETQLLLTTAEDEQHEGDDRQNDQHSPQHDPIDTR